MISMGVRDASVIETCRLGKDCVPLRKSCGREFRATRFESSMISLQELLSSGWLGEQLRVLGHRKPLGPTGIRDRENLLVICSHSIFPPCHKNHPNIRNTLYFRHKFCKASHLFPSQCLFKALTVTQNLDSSDNNYYVNRYCECSFLLTSVVCPASAA